MNDARKKSLTCKERNIKFQKKTSGLSSVSPTLVFDKDCLESIEFQVIVCNYYSTCDKIRALCWSSVEEKIRYVQIVSFKRQ